MLCMSTGMRSIALNVRKSAPMRPSELPSWFGPMRFMYSNDVIPRGIQCVSGHVGSVIAPILSPTAFGSSTVSPSTTEHVIVSPTQL